jgi:hypothetical protein
MARAREMRGQRSGKDQIRRIRLEAKGGETTSAEVQKE